jgi:AraC family transcriptional regulator
LPQKAEPKGKIGVTAIEGGKYAVFTYVGPYEHLGEVYDTIYGKWLPEYGNCNCGDSCNCTSEADCGCILRDAPAFEKYISNPANTPSEKLKTEIYVPIK